MSPDDILAANLWPWPDPLLKRNPSGAIIFVNAAFLQLYGGRVEDWSGRTIPGWPTPNLQGAQRFETRSGETVTPAVYDWVETIMADGNTMAIARNVTIFIPPPAPQPSPTRRDTLEPAPNMPSIPQAPIPPAAIPAAAPIGEAVNIIEDAPVLAPQANTSADFEETLNNDADDYLYDNTAQSTVAETPAKAEPTAQLETHVETQAAESAQEERRMIERRALPIEDSTAVLGNNWRDEVIAKALEAGTPADDKSTKTEIRKSVPTELNEEAVKPREGLNILLAEDNAINALLTRTLLEAEGANVTTVEDGVLAVEAVQANHYDLILMDMRMPNMDGLESTRKIRGLGKTMPIVALTANAFDDDRNACFDSGMNDFMTKPVSAEELSEMVSTWVNNTKEKEKLAS